MEINSVDLPVGHVQNQNPINGGKFVEFVVSRISLVSTSISRISLVVVMRGRSSADTISWISLVADTTVSSISKSRKEESSKKCDKQPRRDTSCVTKNTNSQ